MVNHISVPIIEYDGHKWAALAHYSKDHEITCEEQIKCLNQNYSFKNGHRLRLFKLKKQVYWKIPPTALDITGVPPRRLHRN
jgi:hypothetical protein